MGGMNGRSIRAAALVTILALALAACDQLPMMAAVANAVRSGADTAAPVPGASGNLTTFAPATNGFSLSWTQATDDVTLAANLSYKVVLSTIANIATVAEAETAGGGRSVVKDWAAFPGTVMISGLTTATSYYVVVLVKDAAGNKAIYNWHAGPPSMTVKQGTMTILQGATFSYGTVLLTPVPNTFTIYNYGFGLLDLTNSPPNLVGLVDTNPGGVVFTMVTQPADAIIPSDTRTFIIQAVSNVSWNTQTATVTIPSNDPDKPGFWYTVSALCQS